jgi:hypothetical protein
LRLSAKNPVVAVWWVDMFNAACMMGLNLRNCAGKSLGNAGSDHKFQMAATQLSLCATPSEYSLASCSTAETHPAVDPSAFSEAGSQSGEALDNGAPLDNSLVQEEASDAIDDCSGPHQKCEGPEQFTISTDDELATSTTGVATEGDVIQGGLRDSTTPPLNKNVFCHRHDGTEHDVTRSEVAMHANLGHTPFDVSGLDPPPTSVHANIGHTATDVSGLDLPPATAELSHNKRPGKEKKSKRTPSGLAVQTLINKIENNSKDVASLQCSVDERAIHSTNRTRRSVSQPAGKMSNEQRVEADLALLNHQSAGRHHKLAPARQLGHR